MTDRERVLAKYPNAIAWRGVNTDFWFVMESALDHSRPRLAVWCPDEDAAWADAASRLKDNTEEGK